MNIWVSSIFLKENNISGKKETGKGEKPMGYIHSVESFGTVDGPGVRFVVFFQGCPMRCQYCHNPDTWQMVDGTEMKAEEIIGKMERNISFYSSGGITATGGEPMMQLEFLTELFTLAKEKGIHTCLDTSGILFQEEQSEEIHALMQVTDLVLLDLKELKSEDHQILTGHPNDNVIAFAHYLDQIHKPVWIRHVVVPGITYDEQKLKRLGQFIRTLSNVEKIEVLPYHSMGKVKYDNLDMDYVLKNTPQLTKEETKKAEKWIMS